MRKQTARLPALLFALLVCCLSALSAFAEGGDGTGGGGNRDKPLVLVSSSIANGAEDVDPNARIELTFNKNVVNIVVREQNMQCFSVRDSAGNAVPITVEMGDDQVNPTDAVKRTVTIVPQSPYRAGETYLLTVKSGLAAKNGRDVLEKDTYIGFTVRESAPVAVYASPSDDTTTTTTTTTTAAAATTTKAGTTAASTTAKEKGTAVRTPTLTLPVTGTTAGASQSAGAASAASAATAHTAAETTVYTAVLVETSAAGTEPATEPTEPTATAAEESTDIAEFPTEETAQTSETESAGTQAEPKPKTGTPLILFGVGIAIAAAAAAVIIIKQKSKKG